MADSTNTTICQRRNTKLTEQNSCKTGTFQMHQFALIIRALYFIAPNHNKEETWKHTLRAVYKKPEVKHDWACSPHGRLFSNMILSADSTKDETII